MARVTTIEHAGFSPSLVLATLCLLRSVSAADLHDVQDWIDDPGYENGGTPQEQIKCYALPYGGIGFLSHALTYFTVFCLANGRSPWRPWKKLDGRKWNLAVGILGLVITLPLTALTMYRCKRTWAFILIGVWKLIFSFTLSTISIHAARLIPTGIKDQIKAATKSAFQNHPYGYRNHDPSETQVPLVGAAAAAQSNISFPSTYHSSYSGGVARGSGYDYAKLENYHQDPEAATVPAELGKQQYVKVMYWAWIYFPGSIVGFVGVMKLVRDHFSEISELRTITYVFGGVVGGLTFIVAALACCLSACSDSGKKLKTAAWGVAGSLAFCLFLLTVLFAFYIDWVLAAIAGDMWGVPSRDNAALYWLYFAAKRLPILSF